MKGKAIYHFIESTNTKDTKGKVNAGKIDDADKAMVEKVRKTFSVHKPVQKLSKWESPKWQ